ncbi:MAG: TetR/AcrR family transcriptional regulator [Bacteroidota bacterium]
MEPKEKQVLTPKQKRSIATKDKIKTVAKRLFSEKGYYTVTSNKIASEASVPIGSFYNYYRNKEEILLELIRDFEAAYQKLTFGPFRKLVDTISRKEDIPVSLSKILQLYVLNKHLADPFFKVYHALQFTEPKVLALAAELRRVELGIIEYLLEKMSEFEPFTNTPEKVKLIHSLCENLALYIHHLGTPIPPTDLIDEASRMIYAQVTLQSDSD